MKITLKSCIILAMLTVSLLAVAEEVSQAVEAAKDAAKWCQGPDIKKLTCGWADKDEFKKTSHGTCPECQNWYYDFPSTLPAVVSKSKLTIGKTQVKRLSLACRPGKLLVRAVFKFLPDHDTSECNKLGNLVVSYDWEVPMITALSPVTRCELEVPAFTASDEKVEGSNVDVAEVQAVLNGPQGNGAQESNCKPCNCDAKCENNKVGKWYSDTQTFDFGGCKALQKYSDKDYSGVFPGITLLPGADYVLAKFEVQEVN